MNPPTTIRPRPPMFLFSLLLLLAMMMLTFASQPGVSDAAGLVGALRQFLIVPFPGELWNAPWHDRWLTLLVAPYLHLTPLQALVNAAGLWAFGRRLEYKFGWENLLLFTLAAGLAGSCAELAAGHWPAFGATSIVFAYFGLTLTAAPAQPLLLLGITRRLVRLMYGLLAALALSTIADLIGAKQEIQFTTSVAGPLAGLAFGILTARLLVLRRWRRLSAVGLISLLALCALAAERATWLPAWRVSRASELMRRGELDRGLSVIGNDVMRDSPSSVSAINLSAWMMATAPDERWRSGEQAIALARRANALARWKDPGLIDTLAAAYAEAGHWDAAVAMQKIALRYFDEEPLLRMEEPDPVLQLQRNLEQLERREPIRDPAHFGASNDQRNAHQLAPLNP